MFLRHLTNVGLTIGSLLFAIMAAEGLARVLGVEPLVFSVREAATRTVNGVALWGDQYARYDDEHVQRVSGARDAFKIVGLGDSILYGVFLSKEQTYLEQMRRALSDSVKRDIEVLNLGIPGYNTIQESVAYRELADRLRPDLVLVHYWQDDSQQYHVVGGYVVDLGDISDEEGRRLVQPLPLPSSMNDFLLGHSRLYDLLARVVAANNRTAPSDNWTRVTRPLADIQEQAEGGGGRMVVLASPSLDSEQPRPSDDLARLRDFGLTRGVEVIDLTEWLQGVPSKEVRLDSCHFNAQGHRLLGRRLAQYLRSNDLKDFAE